MGVSVAICGLLVSGCQDGGNLSTSPPGASGKTWIIFPQHFGLSLFMSHPCVCLLPFSYAFRCLAINVNRLRAQATSSNRGRFKGWSSSSSPSWIGGSGLLHLLRSSIFLLARQIRQEDAQEVWSWEHAKLLSMQSMVLLSSFFFSFLFANKEKWISKLAFVIWNAIILERHTASWCLNIWRTLCLCSVVVFMFFSSLWWENGVSIFRASVISTMFIRINCEPCPT